MVYGICYCPVEKLEELEALGVAGGSVSGGELGSPGGSWGGRFGVPKGGFGVRGMLGGPGMGGGSWGELGSPGGSLTRPPPPDSKTLSEGERERRFGLLEAASDVLGWALHVLPPDHISACMQQR